MSICWGILSGWQDSGERRNLPLPKAKEQAGTQINLQKLIVNSLKNLKAALSTCGEKPMLGEL